MQGVWKLEKWKAYSADELEILIFSDSKLQGFSFLPSVNGEFLYYVTARVVKSDHPFSISFLLPHNQADEIRTLYTRQLSEMQYFVYRQGSDSDLIWDAEPFELRDLNSERIELVLQHQRVPIEIKNRVGG